MNHLENKFKALLIFSGLFNIICASLFSIPSISIVYIEFLNKLNMKLNLGGQLALMPSDVNIDILINIAGLHLVLTGIIVLYASMDVKNNLFIPFANSVGRTVFSIIIIYFTFKFDILRIWLIFAIMDIIISSLMVFFSYKFRYKSIVDNTYQRG